MNTPLLRRYALALALIPDGDVAGDLFMDAQDDDDLRRKARAWRRQNGFPELTEDPPLPALTPDDEEYALHLARRGARRQWLRRAGRVGTAVAAVALLFVIGRFIAVPGLAPAVPAWATAAPFTEAITATNTANQVTFNVYRVDATPGLITIWWSATGAGTVKNWKSVQPQAFAPGIPEPERTETALIGRDKVVGRTMYRYMNLALTDLSVGLEKVGSREVKASVVAHINRLDADPEATVYKVSVPQDYTGNSLPDSVAVGPNYIALISTVYGQQTPGLRPPQLWDGDKSLRHLSTEQRPNGRQVDYYEALRAGATTLQIRWNQQLFQAEGKTLDLPGEEPSAFQLSQKGTEPVVILSFTPMSFVGFGFPATAEDETGKRYDLGLSSTNTRPDAPGYEVLFQVNGAAEGVKLVRVTFQHYQPIAAPQFEVHLTQKP